MKKALAIILAIVFLIAGAFYVLDREDIYSVSDLWNTEETEEIENGDDSDE